MDGTAWRGSGSSGGPGRARTDDEEVGLPADGRAALDGLGDAADERQGHRELDGGQAEDLRADAVEDAVAGCREEGGRIAPGELTAGGEKRRPERGEQTARRWRVGGASLRGRARLPGASRRCRARRPGSTRSPRGSPATPPARRAKRMGQNGRVGAAREARGHQSTPVGAAAAPLALRSLAMQIRLACTTSSRSGLVSGLHALQRRRTTPTMSTSSPGRTTLTRSACFFVGRPRERERGEATVRGYSRNPHRAPPALSRLQEHGDGAGRGAELEPEHVLLDPDLLVVPEEGVGALGDWVELGSGAALGGGALLGERGDVVRLEVDGLGEPGGGRGGEGVCGGGGRRRYAVADAAGARARGVGSAGGGGGRGRR